MHLQHPHGKNDQSVDNCHNQTFFSLPSSLSSSLFSSNIRRLQEENARRLMAIYNQPSSDCHGMNTMATMMPMATRFQIRRDSLSHLVTATATSLSSSSSQH
jgi:hypothetical protein